MLGERHDYVPIRDYGHHRGIFNRATVKILWMVSEREDRKKITSEPAEEQGKQNVTGLNKRLRNLDYRT
jgi:hypothetical protein